MAVDPFPRSALAAAALVLLVLAPQARAVTDRERDAEALARSSVQSSFVPDPADPERDLVTGETRPQLEERTLNHYSELSQSDPEQFDRLRRRILGTRTASELHEFALAELAAGRPASAELAWHRLVEEHPEAPEAAPALVKLAASRLRAGERTEAAEDLARIPSMDLQVAASAEPLMARLLAEAEADLARRDPRPTGRDVVVLHPSLASRDLDRTREISEWIDGWELLDEVARTLKIETSGDILRKLKNAGQDDIRLNGIVSLIPLDDRKEGVRIEELLGDPTDPRGAEGRAAKRSAGKELEHFEKLSRLTQAQVLLVARCIEALQLQPAAQALATATLRSRQELALEVASLMAADPKGLSRDDAAVAWLARLADADGDRRLSMLRDDEGLWKPKRPAVEGDMRNAVDKRIDDDNGRPVADLFLNMGMTEQALFHALVSACEEALPGAPARVVPERAELLLSRLAERSAPVWAAAHRKGRKSREGDAERDYVARLNVLRMPGETLDEVLRREVLDDDATLTGPGAVASDARSNEAVAELASLGRRMEGGWLFEDDPPDAAGAPGRSASEKFARAQVLRAQLDDVAAAHALDAMAVSLAADLESQGLHLGAGGTAALKQRVQHEDLGSLAITFDDLGSFTGIQDIVAFTEPGSGLGEMGPGHVAYGFGMDLKSGAPAGTTGWRQTKDIRGGRASLRYHVGATGLNGSPTDVSGASVRFRQREVWQPEIGGDASFLRGFGGRGFLNLIRDVTAKHRKALDAVCDEHEQARKGGRKPFVASMTREDAQARPATLFAQSLGWRDGDFGRDEQAFMTLHDSYEFEKARQKSVLTHEAGKVRFAGFGVSAAFFAGDIYLLAGPKLAFKDYRLFSHFMEGPERRLQSEEAQMRRVAVPEGFGRGRGQRTTTRTALLGGPDSTGQARFTAAQPETRVVEITPRKRNEAPRFASLGLPGAGTLATRPDAAEPAPEAEDDAALLRLNSWLYARGVPLEIRGTGEPSTYALHPAGLASWAAHAIDFHVAAQDGGLGLAISPEGLPLLVAPRGLDGVFVDWLRETRAITRPGEPDQRHRACFSFRPGTPAAQVIEESAFLLRTEVVDGKVVGTARIATGHRNPEGEIRVQANVVAPGDTDAGVRMASIRSEAQRLAAEPVPLPPPVALVRAEPREDGTIADPAALSPSFLQALRSVDAEQVTAVKQRTLRLAFLRSAGDEQRELDAEDVRVIQAISLSHHGRLLSGAALQHAHWVLVNEGLFRADQGAHAQQVAFFERHGVEPFQPDRELARAADPVTRRLLDEAAIDEQAALLTLHEQMTAAAAKARQDGALPQETVPAGTRIVTASRSGTLRGVQWTTSDGSVQAHLLPPLSLFTNEGRYVTALALGADVPALTDSVARQLAVPVSGRDALQDEVIGAIARGLTNPEDERSFSALLRGGTLLFTLAEAPRAGALARCKNATLFPPPYGVDLQRQAETILAAGPVTTVGIAEAGTRFSGRSWAGWRRFSALLGGLLAGGAAAAGDDDDDRNEEPPDDDDGDGGGEEPPPRAGGVIPGREGRGGAAERPTGVREKPVIEEPVDPRDGDQPPGGREGRPDPPTGGGDREPPGEEPVEPRPGDVPPGDREDRPDAPDPSDRPRRPVD